jgi:hypothetical protein
MMAAGLGYRPRLGQRLAARSAHMRLLEGTGPSCPPTSSCCCKRQLNQVAKSAPPLLPWAAPPTLTRWDGRIWDLNAWVLPRLPFDPELGDEFVPGERPCLCCPVPHPL